MAPCGKAEDADALRIDLPFLGTGADKADGTLGVAQGNWMVVLRAEPVFQDDRGDAVRIEPVGDLDALDRLEVLASQFARVDNSSRMALVQAGVASTVHRFVDARNHLARAALMGGPREEIDRHSLSIDQARGVDLDAVLAARRRIAAASGRLEELVPLGAVLADLERFAEADAVYQQAFSSYNDVSPFPLAWVFVFLAVFFLFFNTGPTNTILANVTKPSIRAAGFAVNIFIIHILGDVPSPPLMGWITDRNDNNPNLSFVVVSVLILVGGVFWLLGAKHLERDTAAASTLGAGRMQTFRLVTLPLVRNGLAVGFVTGFLQSFEELTIALFVGGGLKTTLPKQMWDGILLQVNPIIAAASVVVLLVVILMFAIIECMQERRTAGRRWS